MAGSKELTDLMKRFASFDGLEIAYHEWGTPGASPPVFLHHGFVADANSNWVFTGVVDALVAAGRRVIGIDARGHGSSEKPHDPARYGATIMSRDLITLFDIIGTAEVDLVGYSMGGMISVVTATRDPRVRRLVVGGIGSSIVELGGLEARVVPADQVVEALLTDEPATIDNENARAFRMLADALGSDRRALVAVLRAGRFIEGPIPLAEITADTLVLAGRDDPLATRPEVLAAAISGGRLQLVEGDHLTALQDPVFAPTVVGFLAEGLPASARS
jgi:pimeloyl-ACP methyl ester carboxylesterase